MNRPRARAADNNVQSRSPTWEARTVAVSALSAAAAYRDAFDDDGTAINARTG
ncbi:hypothetical protein [Streptomyces sp. NE06-03E]|uniref:hypothetical protein n=1 Tax=Streptomyces sp. NE06-03E TaxID=3028695 RepID=UPI0029C9EA70|nr:hypothetical protein [Streptomyces sp. NE06-03E]